MTDSAISTIPLAVMRLADEMEASAVAAQALDALAITNAPSTLRLRARSVEPARGSLVVAVVGELNAGKSTLVNALVGRKVAATDGFVCTRSVARISPSNRDQVVVRWQDGKEAGLTLPEYLTKCQSNEADRIIEATINVQWDSGYVLLDTPGMGSVNSADQTRAEQGILESDLLLWVMDPSDMLSAREGAFLTQARRNKLPIIVVVSKTDELTVAEVDEVVQCICDRLDYTSHDIVPVSATQFFQTGFDPGMAALQDRLRHAVIDKASTQQAGVQARVREIRDDALVVASQVLSYIKGRQDWAEAERVVLGEQGDVIQRNVLRRATMRLSDLLYAYLERHVGLAPQAPDQLRQMVGRALESFFDEEFPAEAKRLADQLHDEARDQWNQQFEDRRADLVRQMDRVGGPDLNADTNATFLQAEIEVAQARGAAVATGFNVTRSAITMLTAALIINPVGLAGYLVVGAVGYAAGAPIEQLFRSLRPDSEAVRQRLEADKQELAARMQQFANGVAEKTVTEQLTQPMARYLHDVVAAAMEERCRAHLGVASLADLNATVERIAGISHELAALGGAGQAVSRIS